MISYKTDSEICIMRKSGQIIAEVFRELEKIVSPGINTYEISVTADRVIRNLGGIPSFLNYGTPPFPASVCTSVNEEVVHGIPSPKKVLKEGDIVSIDVGVFLEGYHTDAARTYAVGKINSEAKHLIDVTCECFYKGIEQFKPGNRISDISGAIEDHALANGYGIVRELTGHGIGRHLHESPDVPNFRSKGSGIRIEQGLVLAVEPMINLGGSQIYLRDDAWTIATKDSKISAHYENTVALGSDGVVVLTV